MPDSTLKPRAQGRESRKTRFEHVDAVGYDVFQHGDDRGEGREAHEDEEEHAPQLSAGHAVEHVGKGDEHEAGTGARIDVEGETGREDDEARHERDERIQQQDVDGLAGQGALLVDVAAEDGHGADAEAQGEERLPHGGIDGLPDAVLEHLAEVGLQIEQDAFFGPRQGDGADHQKEHDDKQATHHDFGNALDAPLQPHGADEEPGDDRNGHPADLIKRIAERPAEERADLLGRKARKLTRAHVPAVGQHPPGDGRIEHHQHVTADDAPVAVQMPERPLGFQLAERQRPPACGSLSDD